MYPSFNRLRNEKKISTPEVPIGTVNNFHLRKIKMADVKLIENNTWKKCSCDQCSKLYVSQLENGALHKGIVVA